jgi:hypothetical protein
MNSRFSYRELTGMSRARPVTDVPCPACGPFCKTPSNRVRRTLRVWDDGDFITYHCVRCEDSGWARQDSNNVVPFDRVVLARRKAEADKRQRADDAARLEKARWLYAQRQPLAGTIGEDYLRSARAYPGPLPATVGFLPASGDHLPAIVAPFGFPDEQAPGELVMSNDAVRGVQLIRLLPDGSGKAGPPITIGRCPGFPLVLSAVNNGGGLVIAEGVEKALHAGYAFGGCRDDGQFGIGVWASGGKARLPALASTMPLYIEAVSIFADFDEDGGGQRNAEALERTLHDRGVEALIVPGTEWQEVA